MRIGSLDGNPGNAWTATDQRVSGVVEGYFADFIKIGAPNYQGLPHSPVVANQGCDVLRQAIDADKHSCIDGDTER